MFGTPQTRRALTAATEQFAVNPSAQNYRKLLTAAADHQAEALSMVEAAKEQQWLTAIHGIGERAVKASAIWGD